MEFLKKELYTEHIDGGVFVYENDALFSDPHIPYNEIENALSDYETKDKKKLNYVAVELLQNVIKHHDITCDKKVEPVFAIHKQDSRIMLFTGNVINSVNFEKLKFQIDKINSLNEEQLHEYYKYVLNDVGYTEKGGAGLGLIDISRKTKTKINYAARKLSEDYFYFYNIVFYKLLENV
jgi:hypothetical protein